MSAPPIGVNDSCVMDQRESTMVFAFITNGVLLNLFGFFGILGNIISMIILSRPQMRSSINYLLIGLARVDTVLIITSILVFGLYGIYPYTGYMFTYYYDIQPHMASALYFLTTACHTASTYLTVTVSFDRFVAVCNPLRARSLCTYGRARIYVISVMIFSVIYNVPKLWESNIYSDYHPEMNVTIYCVRMSVLRDNVFYKAIYVTWCFFLFMHLIPCLSLLVLNVCIYRQVRIANRERQRLSRLQRREIGLATMLLCVVVVFFACNLLPLIINIIELFQIDISDFVRPLIDLSNLLVTINSSVNFIIYVTFGEKFQRLFLLLFCSHSFFGNVGRDSPEATGHDDSFISNGNRQSMRFHRSYNTSLNRNGSASIRLNGTLTREKRSRTSSPATGVYYPGNKVKEISAVAYTTQTSVTNSDWEHPSTTSTTGF